MESRKTFEWEMEDRGRMRVKHEKLLSKVDAIIKALGEGEDVQQQAKRYLAQNDLLTAEEQRFTRRRRAKVQELEEERRQQDGARFDQHAKEKRNRKKHKVRKTNLNG